MADAAAERRVLDLFEDALSWPDDQRGERLKQAGADEATARRVLSMLEAEERARRLWPTAPADPQPVEEAPPPERIGPWRLTACLGRGGMGAVWLGERDDGLFEQQVAVKLMRPGLFSAAAAERFGEERRLLARLRHPDIARLYDGGVDPDGRPYLVMEFVPGEPITDYVAARRLSPEAVLRLVQRVCQAVQHAHQALVVHADIKPANVLVDEAGAPKLLDFGIARSLAAGGAPEPTGAGLTPAYASPERRDGAPPTPADDVYALGVLLAELTTGEVPEPDRSPVPRDPDVAAIVRRATAPRAEDRYSGAAALADDLQRRLERRPVVARPTGPRRAASLFARRHPLAVGAAMAGVLGLLGAVAVTSTLYVRAERQRAEAERRFGEVRTLARFMLFDVSDRLQTVPGGAALRRDAADVGRRYLETLASVPGAPADLRLEAGAGYGRVGHALALSSIQSTGDSAAGAQALRRAETMLRELHVADPGRNDVAVELAKVLAWRGGVVSAASGDDAAAERLTREALRLLDGVLGRRPEDVAAGYARWNAAIGLGDLLRSAGRDADVAALNEDALRRGARLPVTPEFAAMRPLLEATSELNVGDAVYGRPGGPPLALQRYLRAVAVLERAAASGSSVDVRVADRLVLAQWDVSSTLTEMGRHREALAWADRGVEAARRLTSFDRSVRSRRMAGIIGLQRSAALSNLGRHDEAVAQGREVVELRRTLAAENPGDADLRRAEASAWRPLAETYARAGRRAEACATARRARDAWAVLERDGVMTEFDRRSDLPPTLALLRRCPA